MGKAIATFFLVLGLLFIVIGQVLSSINLNGIWIYPLDDTYIHMSIGKNLAQFGQWGITRYEFSSSSSSILYTLIIALFFKIFGVQEYLPLLLNLLFGVVLFCLLWIISQKEHIGAVAILIIGLLILFLTPLPALIISGMEHTLQILINMLFIYLSALAIESKDYKRKYLVLILILSSLTTMIRFEGVFLISIIASLFFIRKEYIFSVLIFISGFLPIIIFGLISIKNGSYFIPNSLLMKGEKPVMSVSGLVHFAFLWLEKLINNPHLLVLFFSLIIYFLYMRYKKVSFWNRTSVITIIIILTFILHLTFAKTGWFFRYEAYLVFLSLFGFAWIISDQLKAFVFSLQHIWTYLALALLTMPALYPLLARGKEALFITIKATTNIYEQQYQMASFLKKYYNNASVGANDIGAICFYTDIKLLDIFGLGSKEIVDLRIKKEFDKAHIYQLSLIKNTQIVVIYEDWFIGKIPDAWKKAGDWKISDNVILGGETVSFFATEKYDKKILEKNLRKFSKDLPKTIVHSESQNR